jgi:DNA-binding transcriptional LysR family regulator
MKAITDVNLATVDLNLFHVLHTVLEEGSATGAAKKLRVTQSAVSNALARLRQMTNDPLLVRSARGLVPTPRALAIAPLVASGLSQLRAAVAGEERFDPKTTTQRFTLACTDAEAAALMPVLVELFAKRMPNASLRVVTLDYVMAADGPARAEIDAVLGLAKAVPPGCRALPLYTDDIVAIVRKGHPTIRRTLTREQYFTTPHIVIELFADRVSIVRTEIEKVLAKERRAMRIALTVPQFNMVALATARTDYIGGLPRRVAEVLAEYLPLRIFDTPIPLPKLEIGLLWHERTESDPGANFFRNTIKDAVADWAKTRRRG